MKSRTTLIRISVIAIALSGVFALDRLVYFLWGDELFSEIPLLRGLEFEATCEALDKQGETLGLVYSPYFREFPPLDYFRDEYRHPQTLLVDHRDYFWSLRPDAELWSLVPYRDPELAKVYSYHITTNSKGFRTPEFDQKKGDNEFRVVCLGDSRTFGLGVNLDSTYARQLEGKMPELNNRKVSVISAAVPGYSLFQGYRLAAQGVVSWDPDLVVCWFGSNDSWPCHSTDEELHKGYTSVSGVRALLRKSSLYTLLLHLKILFIESRSESWLETMETRRVPPKDYIRLGLSMDGLFAKRSIPVIFISLADGAEYADALSTMSRLGDIPLIKGEELFRKAQHEIRGGRLLRDEYTRLRREVGSELLDRYPALDLFADNSHPNLLGHSVLADALAGEITKLYSSSTTTAVP